MKRKVVAGVVLASVLFAGSAFAATSKKTPKNFDGKRPPKITSMDRPPENFKGERPPMSGDKKPPRMRSGDKRPPEPPEGFNGKRPELPKNVKKSK